MSPKLILILVVVIVMLCCRDVNVNDSIDDTKANNYESKIASIDSISYYKNSDVHYIKHTNIKCFIDQVSDDGLYYDVRTLPDCELIENIHRDSLTK